MEGGTGHPAYSIVRPWGNEGSVPWPAVPVAMTPGIVHAVHSASVFSVFS